MRWSPISAAGGARAGVGHAWVINPLVRTLEVLRLEQGRWMNVGTYRDEQEIRAEPFDAIVFRLGVLWAAKSDPPGARARR